MAAHNELGKWGEDIAAQYLEQKGWYIRERDWRYNGTDIDIVAIDEEDTTLLFVEVKTRSTDTYGRPSEAVDSDKRRRIIEAAAAYLRMFHKENRYVRYDIISIVRNKDYKGVIPTSKDNKSEGILPYSIEHMEDAFTLLDPFEDYRPTSWRRWR